MNLHKLFFTTIILSMLTSLCLLTLMNTVAAEQAPTHLKGKININIATRQQLVMLPGVNRSLSLKIVTFRKRQRLTKIEDILKVQGMDRQLYAKIKRFIVVEGKTTLRLRNR